MTLLDRGSRQLQDLLPHGEFQRFQRSRKKIPPHLVEVFAKCRDIDVFGKTVDQ
jgi:hypothetical protein